MVIITLSNCSSSNHSHQNLIQGHFQIQHHYQRWIAIFLHQIITSSVHLSQSGLKPWTCSGRGTQASRTYVCLQYDVYDDDHQCRWKILVFYVKFHAKRQTISFSVFSSWKRKALCPIRFGPLQLSQLCWRSAYWRRNLAMLGIVLARIQTKWK